MGIIKISLTDDPSKVWTFDVPLTLKAINKIECITELDEGSDNKGSGNYVDGMIYGKEYEFKVSEYYEDFIPTEEEKKAIIWEYAYSNDQDGVTIVTQKEPSGETFKLKVDSYDILGKEISVYAYYGDKESEDTLNIICHNRFRYFDKKIIEQQISKRKHSPWKIDQGASSLCGIALAGFYLARDDFDTYKNFITEMHSKGVALFKNTSYEIEIDSDEHLIEYKSNDSKYSEQSYSSSPMEEIDFIFLLTIKDNLNIVWDYDPDNKNVGGFVEGGTGLTLPNEIETIFEKINDYKDVIDNTNLITSKWSSPSNSISELKKLVQENYKIAILIEGSAFQNNKKVSFSVPTHWVGVLDITENPTSKEIEVLIYTWGTKHKKWILSYDTFKDSYYGYVAGK